MHSLDSEWYNFHHFHDLDPTTLTHKNQLTQFHIFLCVQICVIWLFLHAFVIFFGFNIYTCKLIFSNIYNIYYSIALLGCCALTVFFLNRRNSNLPHHIWYTYTVWTPLQMLEGPINGLHILVKIYAIWYKCIFELYP